MYIQPWHYSSKIKPIIAFRIDLYLNDIAITCGGFLKYNDIFGLNESSKL